MRVGRVRSRWKGQPKTCVKDCYGRQWKSVQQEQTKNSKGQTSWLKQKESIRFSVRSQGSLYVHQELKRLEVSSATGLLVSPFRKCDRCYRLKAYPRELCSIGHKRVNHHCQYCCRCFACETRSLCFTVKPLREGGVKRSLF